MKKLRTHALWMRARPKHITSFVIVTPGLITLQTTIIQATTSLVGLLKQKTHVDTFLKKAGIRTNVAKRLKLLSWLLERKEMHAA